MNANSGSTTLTDKERKLILIIQKQDRLLYLCFYLLLNLAEDVSVERKMCKRSIVPHLLQMLERANVELLILAATFLKKLTIYKENVVQMSKVLSPYATHLLGILLCWKHILTSTLALPLMPCKLDTLPV